MSHPPLPPNCDLLYEPEASKGPYWIINNLAETSICLVDTDKDDRKVIAAVARCSWLDEAERIEDFESLEFHDQRMIAHENAVAWQEWGNKK